MKRNTILFAVALLIAAAVVALAWRFAHHQNRAELERVAASINLQLPRPYVDELVMDHAHVDGNRLVVDIRIPDISIKQLDPKKIPLIHRQEQSDLNEQACADSDMASLLRHKAEVARRFVDRDRATIFEIVVNVPKCKPNR